MGVGWGGGGCQMRKKGPVYPAEEGEEDPAGPACPPAHQARAAGSWTPHGAISRLCFASNTCSRLLNTTRGYQSSLCCLKHVTKWFLNISSRSVVFALLKTRNKMVPEHHTGQSVVFVLLQARDKMAPEHHTGQSVVFVLLETRDTMARKVPVVRACWSTVWASNHVRAKYCLLPQLRVPVVLNQQVENLGIFRRIWWIFVQYRIFAQWEEHFRFNTNWKIITFKHWCSWPASYIQKTKFACFTGLFMIS